MIQKLYLIERLRSCKISTLNDLAILTGSPIISTNKSCRIEGLTAGYYFYLNHYHKFLSTQKQRTTLSIDVGIKNFSYCKSKSSKSTSSSTLITSNFSIIITKWDKLNLDTQYGGDNYSLILHKDSILDNKRYLNQLTKSLVNELQPNEYDVVIMEIQRTRSAGNTSTLPTVLLNYTLENLIFGNIYPQIVIPMTSFKMTNFWLHRFITRSTTNTKQLKSNNNNKGIRFELMKLWLNKLFILPKYPQNELTKLDLLKYLKLDKSEKIDDLIDSLLYNLTINCQFQHLAEFHQLMVSNNGDIAQFVHDKNKYHLQLIQPIIDKYELELKPGSID